MTVTDSGFSSEEPSWLADERVETGESSPVPASPAPAASPAASPAAESASSPEAAAVAVAEPVVAVSKASIADIEEAMKDVVDPELGINVVDLGLVYDAFVDDDNVATLDMTLTSAACPLTDVIEDQTRAALTTGPGGGLVQDFRINWVWLPPWGPDKITDDGREQLRALGFNV
jgi:metal-sulfur cluster biosynthetic enzyme